MNNKEKSLQNKFLIKDIYRLSITHVKLLPENNEILFVLHQRREMYAHNKHASISNWRYHSRKLLVII